MKQKNFSDIYNELSNSYGLKLKKQRDRVLIAFILLIIAVIAIFIYIIKFKLYSIPFYAIILMYFLIPILAVVIGAVIFKNYKYNFKFNIITNLVEKSNNTFSYNPKGMINVTEYANSGFESHWDRYSSEDFIEGRIEKNTIVRMAQVHTEQMHVTNDGNGHTTVTYVTKFLGLYGILELPVYCQNDISILNNSKLNVFNKSRVEMESAEFEKYYDVFTFDGNRQGAMELITPESIEKITQIRNIFKRPINLRICGNKIYFRIECGDIFEPPTFKSPLNYKLLEKYFNIIDVPRAIYEALIDNIIIMSGDTSLRLNRELEKKKQQDS